MTTMSNAARMDRHWSMGRLGLVAGVAAICTLAGLRTAGGAAAADSASDVKVPPHSSWKSPDGTKVVVNDGPTPIYLTLHFHYLDLLWIECAIPLNGSATVKGFSENNPKSDSDDDTIDVHGKVKLDNCDGTDIALSKGGNADCEDCDHNEIEFGTGGGTIRGEHNDDNKIKGSKANGGETSGFHGKNNRYSG